MVVALVIKCTEIVESIVKRRRVEFNFKLCFFSMPVFGHDGLHDLHDLLLERGLGPGLHSTEYS